MRVQKNPIFHHDIFLWLLNADGPTTSFTAPKASVRVTSPLFKEGEKGSDQICLNFSFSTRLRHGKGRSWQHWLWGTVFTSLCLPQSEAGFCWLLLDVRCLPDSALSPATLAELALWQISRICISTKGGVWFDGLPFFQWFWPSTYSCFISMTPFKAFKITHWSRVW